MFHFQARFENAFPLVCLVVMSCISPPPTSAYPVPSVPSSCPVLDNVRSSVNETIALLQKCQETYVASGRLDFTEIVQLMDMLNSEYYPLELHFENIPFHGNISLLVDADRRTIYDTIQTMHRDISRFDSYMNLSIAEEENSLSRNDIMSESLLPVRVQGLRKVKGDLVALLQKIGQHEVADDSEQETAAAVQELIVTDLQQPSASTVTELPQSSVTETVPRSAVTELPQSSATETVPQSTVTELPQSSVTETAQEVQQRSGSETLLQSSMTEEVTQGDVISEYYKAVRQSSEKYRHFLDFLVLHRCNSYMVKMRTLLSMRNIHDLISVEGSSE